MTTVSVLMPAFNAEKYIERAIESVIYQSYSDWELLIIDDCSADKTGSICDSYGKNEERIRVVHLTKNVGISRAKNIGLSHALGKYIAFCDDDDFMYENTLEDNMFLMEQYRAQVVRWSYKRIKMDEGGKIEERERNCRDGVYRNRKEIFENYDNIHSMLSCDWTGLYDRCFLKKNNIRFNEEYRYGAEDTDFNLTVLRHIEKTVMNSKCYYDWYLRRGHSTMSKRNINFCYSMIEVANKEYSLIADNCSNMDLWCQYEQYYRRYILNYARALSNEEKGIIEKKMQNDDWYKGKETSLASADSH